MDKKALSYIFEYSIDLPISFTCSYCNKENESIHKIVKKHEEIVMVNKSEDSYSFNDNEKEKIFNELENKANQDLNVLKERLSKNKTELVKNNKCSYCLKDAAFSLKNAFRTRLSLQIIIYVLIILFSLGLNALMQPLMLALLNNYVGFFTSIFFYPSVFFVVCLIFFIFDYRKLKKTYLKEIPKEVFYPKIYEDRIEINKKLYINPRENKYNN